MNRSKTFKLDGVKYYVTRSGLAAVEVQTRIYHVPCRVFLGSWDGINLVPTRRYQNADNELRASIECALVHLTSKDDYFFTDTISDEIEVALTGEHLEKWWEEHGVNGK